MSVLRVALVDDHPIVLAGIRALVEGNPSFELVGEATCAAEALELVERLHPDVLVMDVSLPDSGGTALAEKLTEVAPATRLLALTVHEDRAYVQPLMACGVSGYILKRSAAEDLLRAIRAVADGGLYLDPAIAQKALPSMGEASDAAPELEALTPREEEVMRLLAQGHSNKEVAYRLDVSVKTVETHKARAAEKLGLRSRAEIVQYGASHGWLPY